eukprot:TRINITY_DN1287_c0_g1_i3.p1 TRINITY_DN1287_c0_g1~~TRINITY_DN1287_c0_g1_i3.p1  ORF type:complete len:382 (-),score=94.56 TRINITY_DN1287_c0_g1_i3:121-1266(-)
MFAAIQKNKNMSPEEREKVKASRQKKRSSKKPVFKPPPMVRYETVGPFKDKDKILPYRMPKEYDQSDLNRLFPALTKGTFGIVYKGHVADYDEVIVIKDLEVQDEESVEEWQLEIILMAKNRSPYIAEVFGYAVSERTLSIVMPFFAKGDLFGILHRYPEKHNLNLLHSLRMARHIALGVSVLHANNIIHRDIKSLNMLVTDSYGCVLTDLGLSKIVDSKTPHAKQMHTQAVGTPLWMAPEVRDTNFYGYASDIFSIGLVFYELFQRKLFGYCDEDDVQELPSQFMSAPLVLPLLAADPMDRPTASELIQLLDQFLRNVVEMVAQSLPPEVQEKIAAEKPVESPRDGDPFDAHLMNSYNHLLTMDKTEIDRQVANCFNVFL